MSKKTVLFSILCLIFTVMNLSVSAMPSYTDIDKITIEKKDYLPLRTTFETLGYSVKWQADRETAVIEKQGTRFIFTKGQHYMLYNDVLKYSSVSPKLHKGKMYVSIASLHTLFNDIKLISPHKVRIYNRLKPLEKGAINLSTKRELNALLSFYPRSYPVIYEDVATEDVKKEVTPDYSGTNNQVKGVDESDYIKTDGKHIFAIKENSVQIIKANPNKPEILYTLNQKNIYPEQLFITEDKLVVIGSAIATDLNIINEGDEVNIRPKHYSGLTYIHCYDINRLSTHSPKLVKSFSVEGNMQSGRKVENYIYLVINNGFYDVIPYIGVKENNVDSMETISTIKAQNIRYFPGHVDHNIIYTIGLDLNNLSTTGLDVQAYLGRASSIYANRKHLFISGYANQEYWKPEQGHMTDIYKFKLNRGKVEYVNMGSVNGSMLNQFSMDEHKSHLRIATTTHVYNQSTSLNHLYILNADMKVVGKLENLAKGERIYSTRMMGDKVFIVTYRQVDPFYVIDASNPDKPHVLGYLKIPGYSSYLHPYDTNTIIGVGMHTKTVEDRVVNDGVKISLFDISDVTQPIEKDKLIFGSGNAYTDVNYDHKAFTFNKDKNILALPISMTNEQGNNVKNAYILNFNSEGKLKLKGTITHRLFSEELKHYDNTGDQISRIFYIDNALYTLSSRWLAVNDFYTLEKISHLKR